MSSPFLCGKWVWATESHRNQYVLFSKSIDTPASGKLIVRITASYYYELFVNGKFLRRGPVHCDPKWCQYDEFELEFDDKDSSSEKTNIAIVAHHPGDDVYLHFIFPGPRGLCAEFEHEGTCVGTDESWKCLDLPMWDPETPKKGNPLGPAEDYNAAKEPGGWNEKTFSEVVTGNWASAALIGNADQIWLAYQKRMVPYLERSLVEPKQFKSWRADNPGAESVYDISKAQDEEPLLQVKDWQAYSPGALSGVLDQANAFTFDLGAEHVGFYSFELEAPEGTTVEVSGSELLRDGRPWIFRKGVSYSMRYRTREGRQNFTSFSWNGFRYIHLIIRGGARNVRIHGIGCVQRKPPLKNAGNYQTDDSELQQIYDLCKRTLEVGVQEHLIDCPTREQTQYWGDALFVAQSIWKGFNEKAYLDWYMECFLRVPVRENGQISCVYPGDAKQVLLDYTLIPPIGQRFYLANFGVYYKPQETLERGLKLKEWYDRHLNGDGLVAFDFDEYAKSGLRNFIDHPGMGWHNFPHRGIDRQGVSCPLNTFFYGNLTILAELADYLGHAEARALRNQAEKLSGQIIKVFFDDEVFHDAMKDRQLSEGTSWQTNCLTIFFDLVKGEQATQIMQAMLDRYDDLCRCSPYFHFFFLPAMRKAGMETEAVELIKREYRPMLERDATTTWEGFLGDDKDSLCHPWSTAPFLFLLEQTAK